MWSSKFGVKDKKQFILYNLIPMFIGPLWEKWPKKTFFNRGQLKFFWICFYFWKNYFIYLLYSWHMTFQRSKMAGSARCPSHFGPQFLRTSFWMWPLLPHSWEFFQRCFMPIEASCMYVYVCMYTPLPSLFTQRLHTTHTVLGEEGWDYMKKYVVNYVMKEHVYWK